MQMPAGGARILSVGHSNHTAEFFVKLLKQAGVGAVADVRSSPFSRWLPHFNRAELAAELQRHGIRYFFLGDELGGRPSDDALYDEFGRVDYEQVRATGVFRQGLERLLALGAETSAAMLCSEEDPLDCHRGLMIAPALSDIGVTPLHLRKDGRIETMREMEERLLDETGIGAAERGGLFPLTDQDRRELLAEAYRAMARRKSFRIQPETT